RRCSINPSQKSGAETARKSRPDARFVAAIREYIRSRLLRGPWCGTKRVSRGDQGRLPQGGAEAPSRQEPWRCKRRGEVQGGGRGLFRAFGHRQAGPFRPIPRGGRG